MPRGASVVRYQGKRGVVWRVKYVDANGRHVMETLGPEREGWTERKAQAELRERLVRVDRNDYVKPGPLTFGAFAETWLAEGRQRRQWKPATLRRYRNVIRHLCEHFGPFPLAAIRPRHVSEYVAEASGRLAANTVIVHISVLHDVFNSAVREELVDANPTRAVERPKRPRNRWRILTPQETRATLAAYDTLAAQADDDLGRDYMSTHRLAFLTLMLTGLRQHELRALRWRDVDLIENTLRVADSKTDEGVRSIALPPSVAEELWQHRRRSAFQGDDEYVFCHPQMGGRYGIERHRKALRRGAVRGRDRRVRATVPRPAPLGDHP